MQFNFFEKKPELIIDHDGIVEYYPQFFERSDIYLERLFSEVQFSQNQMRIWGKEVTLPRLECWYGESEYTYSGMTLKPHPWSSTVLEIKNQIENLLHESFNSCLVNLYRNGDDYVGPHADDEKELGKNPVIASVSFGASRKFLMKHRLEKQMKHELLLHSGDLLVMKGEFQHSWTHSLPKMKKELNPRINLTFRKIHKV